MKRFLLLPIFFVLLLSSVSAQEKSEPAPFKKNYTGLAFRGGWGRSFGFVGDMELRYGRFINGHWLVGAAVDFRQSYRFNQQSFGVFARYYFNEKQKGFFLEASHKYGIAEQLVTDAITNQVLESSSGTMTNTFLGGGYTFVNKKNLGIELFAGWESNLYNMNRLLAHPSFTNLDQGFTSGFRIQYKF